MPLKPINVTPRLYPHKFKAPYLQGDDRGGHVACQNITINNVETGEIFTCHAAEPASRDPYAPENIKGNYLKRVEKERKQVPLMSPNSPLT